MFVRRNSEANVWFGNFQIQRGTRAVALRAPPAPHPAHARSRPIPSLAYVELKMTATWNISQARGVLQHGFLHFYPRQHFTDSTY